MESLNPNVTICPVGHEPESSCGCPECDPEAYERCPECGDLGCKSRVCWDVSTREDRAMEAGDR